jgi:hypothetical protein
MAGSGVKSTPSVEDAIANMSAQIEKLAAAFAGIQANQETLQGDQTRLTVAVNRLQSVKIADGDTSAMAPHHDKAMSGENTGAITRCQTWPQVALSHVRRQ